MKQSLIFTGYLCNESCFFCSAEVNGRKHINKTTKEILKEILIEHKSGSKSMELIGGEVLLRKDIFVLISFIKKVGFHNISIETNGTLLSDIIFCEKILKCGLNNIVMSIHGSTSITNDFHTNLSGSFELKVKAIKNLEILSCKYNFNLSTNYVLTSKNVFEVPNFLELISKYNFINKIIFAFVRPIKSYKETYDNYLPNFKDIKKFFESIDINKKVLIQYLPYCVLDSNYNEAYLNDFSKGFKKEVKKINIGNSNSLEDAIQSEEYYFEECKKCIFINKCRGVWKEYVDHFNMKRPPLLGNKINNEKK